jgi:hypothetical protein
MTHCMRGAGCGQATRPSFRVLSLVHNNGAVVYGYQERFDFRMAFDFASIP